MEAEGITQEAAGSTRKGLTWKYINSDIFER
jgi:hypothetical protein